MPCNSVALAHMRLDKVSELADPEIAHNKSEMMRSSGGPALFEACQEQVVSFSETMCSLETPVFVILHS